MELTSFAWLLVLVAFMLGFLASYFLSKPKAPPLLYGGKRFKVWKEGEEKPKIPATGGTVNFEDAYGNEFQVQLPQQTRAREITFTSLKPRPLSEVPDPRVYRILMHLTATDAEGKVDTFDPYMTTIAKYIDTDLEKVKGDPNRLRRYYYYGTTWRQLAMPVGARDTKKKTLTAYVGTFSSCAVGG